MRVTLQLTLDGLVRALRLKGHGLAEDVEGGYRRNAQHRDAGATMPSRSGIMKVRGEDDDDGARR